MVIQSYNCHSITAKGVDETVNWRMKYPKNCAASPRFRCNRRSRSTERGEADACCPPACTTARRPQATSWELWAAMRLARLWQEQGKRSKARALLAPLYGWGTTGFDRADVQEAKTLREALAG